VMCRATLGHSGRALTAGPGTTAIFGMITLAALFRVGGGAALGDFGAILLLASGAAWIAAFGLFLALYGPILLRPRLRA